MVTLLDDDVLTRALIEANPARTPTDARPDDEALRMRARIMAPVPTRRAPRRARARWAWGSGIAATAAAAAVVVGVIAPQGAAVAVTPKPLVFADAGSAASIVDRALEALSADSGPAEPVRTVESIAWSLSVEVEEQRSEVVPQFIDLTWNEDMSGRMTILAGEGYWPSDISGGSGEVTIGDEVLMDLEMKPGEFNTPVAQTPGESSEDVRAMLTAYGMPENPSASDVLAAIVTAVNQWTLTDEQHAAMLELLESSGGVHALGSTTDRLGRQVYALGVDSSGVSEKVLISAATGRIVGVETEQTTDDGIVPAGAVVFYSMWDLSEGD